MTIRTLRPLALALAMAVPMALAAGGASANQDCLQDRGPDHRAWCDAEQSMHASCNVYAGGYAGGYDNAICVALPRLDVRGSRQNIGGSSQGGTWFEVDPVSQAGSGFVVESWQSEGVSNAAPIGFGLLKLRTGHCPSGPPLPAGAGYDGPTPQGNMPPLQCQGGGAARLPVPQPVALISFGRTTLDITQATTIARDEALAFPGQPCKGALKRSSNISFPGGGEILADFDIDVVGQNRSGGSPRYLVHTPSFSGMVRGEDIVLYSDACQDALPEVSLEIVEQARDTPAVLPAAYAMNLVNEPNEDLTQYEADWVDGFPTSGLLIINPTDQRLVMKINETVIILASSAYFRQANGSLMIIVLDGQVQVRHRGWWHEVRTGQTLSMNPDGSPRPRNRPRTWANANWCEWLGRIARAAFSVNGRLTVPAARLDYCGQGRSLYLVDATTLAPQGAVDRLIRANLRPVDRPPSPRFRAEDPVSDTPIRRPRVEEASEPPGRVIDRPVERLQVVPQ